MKIGMFLKTGPYQSENWETLYHLASAALDRGHKILVFLHMDAVYNVNSLQRIGTRRVPKDCFAELIDRGAQIAACGLCAVARGLSRENLLEGVAMKTVTDLAREVAESDRFIVL